MKLLHGKAYASIPHLPGSRMTLGDHRCSEEEAHICTVATRDEWDRVIVEEKLDGACVAAARIEGSITALTRSGERAWRSPYRHHQLFARWVQGEERRFRKLLREGERACGEWLALAHGTRYQLFHEPFVLFDIIRGEAATGRLARREFWLRAGGGRFVTPRVLHDDHRAIAVREVVRRLEPSGHGALDPVEGAVWRVERGVGEERPVVCFLAKYVRPEKVPGAYFCDISGQSEVWNWQPRER